MIHFEPIELDKKELYETLLHNSSEHGCEYTFTNLFMWGTQQLAFLENHVVLFSEFDCHCFYPFPIGNGDKKTVLETIFADAKEREICCCLTGLNSEDKQTLETLYPGKFYFQYDRSNSDYVYNIHDLADLKGRKLHRKRNHLKHFQKNHPNCVVEPISDNNIKELHNFISAWYQIKLVDTPEEEFHNEQAALEKALSFYKELEMEGLILKEDDTILAFTLGRQMSPDTFDVHFEKARGDIDGAYTTINNAFANYIRDKYPHILYLNREEDMGIPGLRKAKQSYFPHHMVKKYKAFPLRKSFAFQEATTDMISGLRTLWKEAFHDSDEFLDNFFSTGYHPDHCRVATIDGNLAAALYWFDCSIDGQAMAYVYGVATAQAYRGNGACHTLLADTHKYLKALGYKGVLLVPGCEALVKLYEGAEYELSTKRSHIECIASDMGLLVHEISKNEYAALRYKYLPKGSVIQENENLDFLGTQAKFYTGENTTILPHTSFVLAANMENETLHGIELLGDTTLAAGIVYALGYKNGTFFTVGKDENFAMFHALSEDAAEPEYFGFAFD